MYSRIMGRGQRTTPRFGSRAARQRPATRRVTLDAKAAVDALFAEAQGDTWARARRRYNAALAKDAAAPPDEGHTLPATNLRNAIRAAQDGDEKLRANIPALLDRALRQQEAYVATLETGGTEAAPGFTALWKAKDLHHELLRICEDLSAPNPPAPLPDNKAVRRALHELLNERLDEGDIDGIQSILVEFVARDAAAIAIGLRNPTRLSRPHVEAAARVAAAEREIGLDTDLLGLVTFGRPEQRIADHLLDQRGGDEAERLASEAGFDEIPDIAPADNAARVLAVARAMLRNRAHHRAHNHNDEIDGDVRLVIPATMGALAEMVNRGAMGGQRIGVIVHDAAASAKGQRRRLRVEIRHAFLIAGTGERHVISVVADLDRPTATQLRQPHWIANALVDAGAIDLAAEGYTFQPDTDDAALDNVGVSRLDDATAETLSAMPHVRHTDDVLGPDRCTHANADWVGKAARLRIGAGAPSVVAHLRCPDCLRDRIAVVPLHRFPPGHPMRALTTGAHADEDANTPGYVQWRRYCDTLAGRDSDVQSIDDLVARDGLIATDPTRYGTAAGSAARAARRPRSIREAMNRR